MPLAKDVDLKYIAEKTEGYVGADLENLCREAGMMAYRQNPDATEITQQNFIDAMKVIRPSVDQEILKFYDQLSESINKNVMDKKKKSPVEELGLYQ